MSFCLPAFSVTFDDTSVILILDPLCVTCFCSQKYLRVFSLSPVLKNVTMTCLDICFTLFIVLYTQCAFQSGKFWEISFFYFFDDFSLPFCSVFLWNSFYLKDEPHGLLIILSSLSCFQLFFVWHSKRHYHLIHFIFFYLPVIILYSLIFLSWM